MKKSLQISNAEDHPCIGHVPDAEYAKLTTLLFSLM